VKYFDAIPALTTNGASYGAYARPAFGTFGNIQRDSLFGPHYFNTDFSVAKNFQITEKLRMQLTAQAFNVFNHANLAGPNSSCVDCQVPTTGYITSTVGSQDGSSMRRLQFAGRFQF
jgi:hypothetical protein